MATGWESDEEFAQLFDEYRDVVFHWAAKWVGPTEADDVVQEVMLRAYRGRPEISAERRISPWLRTVTRNVCVDVLRRRREVPSPELTIEELSPPGPDEPESAGIRLDARQRLRLAWGRLSPRDAEILARHDLRGESAADIAVVRGTSANTVRQQVHRARKVLLRHYRAVGGTLSTLLPWPGLRRVLSRLRARRASAVLPATMGVALIAALLLLPQPSRPPSICLLAYRTSWLVGRTWVPGPAHRNPSPSTDRALVYDTARREYVLVSAADPAPRTWTWTAPGWAERRPARPLRSRLRNLLGAYDPVRHLTVVVGWNEADEMETWTWDGSGWTQDTPPSSVPVLDGASLAYFSPARKLVLFGGAFTSPLAGNGGPVTTTRTMSDTTWVRPPGRAWVEEGTSDLTPPARTGAAMAYDATRHELVLFGGIGQGGAAPLGDTWLWDGTAWRRGRPDASLPPPSRAGAALVDTPAGPLLYGGTDVTGSLLNDVWVWNGDEERWITGASIEPEVDPGPLAQDPRMAYDAVADEVLLSNSSNLEDAGTGEIRSAYFLRAPGSTPRPTPTVAPVAPRSPEPGRSPARPGGPGSTHPDPPPQQPCF